MRVRALFMNSAPSAFFRGAGCKHCDPVFFLIFSPLVVVCVFRVEHVSFSFSGHKSFSSDFSFFLFFMKKLWLGSGSAAGGVSAAVGCPGFPKPRKLSRCWERVSDFAGLRRCPCLNLCVSIGEAWAGDQVSLCDNVTKDYKVTLTFDFRDRVLYVI